MPLDAHELAVTALGDEELGFSGRHRGFRVGAAVGVDPVDFVAFPVEADALALQVAPFHLPLPAVLVFRRHLPGPVVGIGAFVPPDLAFHPAVAGVIDGVGAAHVLAAERIAGDQGPNFVAYQRLQAAFQVSLLGCLAAGEQEDGQETYWCPVWHRTHTSKVAKSTVKAT